MDGSHVLSTERRMVIIHQYLQALNADPAGNRDAIADQLWQLVVLSDSLSPPRRVYLLEALGRRLHEVILPPLWYEYIDSQIAARLINLGERGNGHSDGPVAAPLLASAHRRYGAYGKRHGLDAGKVRYHRQRAKQLRHPILYRMNQGSRSLAKAAVSRLFASKTSRK